MSHVLYVSGHRQPDTHRRFYVPIFSTAESARSWLMKFINGAPHEWDGADLVMSPGFDIRIRCSTFKSIFAAKDTEEVTAEAVQLIARFKYGTWEELHLKPADPIEDDGTTTRAPRPVRERRADAPPSFVTITALCAGSGVLPTHARAALRASGRAKPEYGWAFDPKEVPAIKKLIGLSS